MPFDSPQFYMVSTPIGNLEDITQRALDTLKQVDLIAAEDTRQTKKLLNRYQVNTPLQSLHSFNEQKATSQLIKNCLDKNLHVAIVSDAGTPCLNDPGYLLVKQASEEKIPTVTIPGASSLTAAISLSTRPTQTFTFIGFLPATRTARIKLVKKYISNQETPTLIFFCTPHNVHNVCTELCSLALESNPELHLELFRELTKKFEERISLPLKSFTPDTICEQVKAKGEFVGILYIDNGQEKHTQSDLSDDMKTELTKEIELVIKTIPSATNKEIINFLKAKFGLKKGQIYPFLVEYKNS